MFGKRADTVILDEHEARPSSGSYVAYDHIPLHAASLYPPLRDMDRQWQRQKIATHDMLRDAMAGLGPDDIMLELIEHLAGRPDVCGAVLERHSNDLRRLAWRLQRGEA